MATPIQHTSQFIPSNVGLMERGLAETQQRADAAYQGMLQADTQFATTMTTNQDANLKDSILNSFRNKSKDIVTKYGGDYAKASKELAREVVKAGNNPFWQLNAAKQRGIEQYNQMKAKLGSNAIEGYNPATTPIYSEQSGFTSPEQFSPVLYDASVLAKGLESTFGPRKQALNDTLLKEYSHGLLTADRIKGIEEEMVPQLAADMYNQLRSEASMVNQYGDAQLKQMANDTAQSYVLGTTKYYRENPEWLAAQRRRASSDNSTGVRNYIMQSMPGRKTGVTSEEAISLLQDYKNAKSTTEFDLNDLGVDSKDVTQDMLIGAKLSNKNRQSKIDKALKHFKGDMYDDLVTNQGKSEEEAIEIVANHMASKPITHDTMLKPKDPKNVNAAIVRDLGSGLRLRDLDEVTILGNDGSRDSKRREKYEDGLKDHIINGDIQDIGFNAKGNELYLFTKDNVYALPSNVIANRGASEAIRNYSKLFDVIYGNSPKTSEAVKIGNNTFVARKRFDKDQNFYVDDLVIIDNKGNFISAEDYYDIDNTDPNSPTVDEAIADRFFTDLFASLGVQSQTKYKTNNIENVEYLTPNR